MNRNSIVILISFFRRTFPFIRQFIQRARSRHNFKFLHNKKVSSFLGTRARTFGKIEENEENNRKVVLVGLCIRAMFGYGRFHGYLGFGGVL